MANTVLFVFEGERTERRIFDALKKEFFQSHNDDFIIVTYNTDIYQLWSEIAGDEFLDIVELLKGRNRDVLANISRDDIDQVYLFFDYDGHAPNASDDAIGNMLEWFSNETEHGMLYVSYPMVEAFKDINDDHGFRYNFVSAKDNIHYKALVGERGKYLDIRYLESSDWDRIISANLCKANYIVCDKYQVPEELVFQSEIFEKQLERFVEPDNQVGVLSAFPFFVVEYFGLGFRDKWRG